MSTQYLFLAYHSEENTLGDEENMASNAWYLDQEKLDAVLALLGTPDVSAVMPKSAVSEDTKSKVTLLEVSND